MEISDWQWDERNISHLAEHQITPRIVIEIAELDDPRFRDDEDEEHSGTHHMLGMDGRGTIWVICIVEVNLEDHLWRAFTGWKAEEEDIAWYWGNA